MKRQKTSSQSESRMAKPKPRKTPPSPQPIVAVAPPLNRAALIASVAAYVLWLLFLFAVATGLIR